MSGIFKRLYHVARAYRPAVFKRDTDFRVEDFKTDDARFDSGREGSAGWKSRADETVASAHPSLPKQVIEDLAVFNLAPPVTLEDIRKARNREIKKFHSDKFINDPERFKTSKEIMQIYNAAYDRLKVFYQKSR